MSQEFECRLPILPTAPCCPSCHNLANQGKPETIANVNKHVKSTMLHSRRRESLLTKTIVSLIEYAYRVPQKSDNLVKDFTLNCEHTKSRLTKRSRSQMSSQGSSESCRLQCQRHKTTEHKKMSKTGHSPAREKRSSARKSEGSQFCSRVSENENAILNIDNVVSLEHSTRVKFVML